MLTISDMRAAGPAERLTAVAIGNFDGFHLGHAAVIRSMVTKARQSGLVASVLTFNPHTARVFARAYAPPLITTYAERAALIKAAGPDLLVEQAFDDAIAGMTAGEFAASFLHRLMNARAIFVGHDFTYGRGRAGTVETRREFCNGAGLFVEVVPQVRAQGIPVSSTRIREFIHEGNMEGAALLLGRRYAVHGRVVQGAGRGRSLGFPTANIEGPWEITPPAGVYAAFLQIENERLRAAVNIGTNPTFGEGPMTVEAFILDYAGDAYGADVALEFVHRMRPELRFPSAEALSKRIAEDVAAIGRLLGEAP